MDLCWFVHRGSKYLNCTGSEPILNLLVLRVRLISLILMADCHSLAIVALTGAVHSRTRTHSLFMGQAVGLLFVNHGVHTEPRG